jgi:hypothetical protein
MRRAIKILKNVAILHVVMVVFFVFCGFTMLQAQNMSEQEIHFTRHIPTLNDDFADNRVIVTLRQAYSDVNKPIDMERFRTTVSNRSVIETIEDLTYMINPYMITNRASFAQILSIELRENCKENVLRVIEELEQLDKVLAAEPDYNFIPVHDSWTPTDPMFNQQWGLRGTNGIQAQQAWGIERGNTTIRVGVMESGFQANHEDLQGNTLTLPGQCSSIIDGIRFHMKKKQ